LGGRVLIKKKGEDAGGRLGRKKETLLAGKKLYSEKKGGKKMTAKGTRSKGWITNIEKKKKKKSHVFLARGAGQYSGGARGGKKGKMYLKQESRGKKGGTPSIIKHEGAGGNKSPTLNENCKEEVDGTSSNAQYPKPDRCQLVLRCQRIEEFSDERFCSLRVRYY